MSKGPGPIGQGVGLGILLIPIVFCGGGWTLGKIVALLTWLFG
jgi:hypothetical protein